MDNDSQLNVEIWRDTMSEAYPITLKLFGRNGGIWIHFSDKRQLVNFKNSVIQEYEKSLRKDK
jgi:hypothetical protein